MDMRGQGGDKTMKTILHIGAHRCANATFHHYLARNSAALNNHGLRVWGPQRTGSGLLRGIIPSPGDAIRPNARRRGIGRVRMNLAHCAQRGAKTLLISDANMMGPLREAATSGALYPSVGERMARYHEAFDSKLNMVVINLRSPDHYWGSVATHCQNRAGLTSADGWVDASRTWRDVITDVACAMPETVITVCPFETFGGRPDVQLRALTGLNPPRQYAREWLNRTSACGSGTNHRPPFGAALRAKLRETYADDMMWLTAGADGLAQLMQDPDKTRTGPNPSATDLTRGRPNDDEKSRMASPR